MWQDAKHSRCVEHVGVWESVGLAREAHGRYWWHVERVLVRQKL